MMSHAAKPAVQAGYYRHIAACNPPLAETFLPWRIDDQLVGWVRPSFTARLQQYPDVFRCLPESLELVPDLADFDTRSAALLRVAHDLAACEVIPPVMDEPYAVTPAGREAALCVVDRAAAAYFGVRSFGQHLNGFVRTPGGIEMWIGRRARDRLLFPGALDNMVAGGLPHALSLGENLLKECEEEAGVPAALAGRAVAVGALAYNRVAERGYRRDVLYCYDLELPDDFEPRNTDGEVESFMRLPLAEVAALVRETDEFKLNCNLVVIDFLIRHGWLDPQAPEYLALVMGLRQPLGHALPAG
jgi:8-oxo-dGTP pyrophosphatase MutT (NUDIX family)